MPKLKPPTKRTAKPATQPERSADQRAAYARLVDVYFEAFEACTGSKPPFDAREGKAMWKLFDKVGLDRGEKCLRNAFGDEFGKRRSILTIADDPAKVLGSAPRTGVRYRPVQPSHGVDIWKLHENGGSK